MTQPFGEPLRAVPPRRDGPGTGGLSIADRRTIRELTRNVAVIRRWVTLFGVLIVCGLLFGASVLVVSVGNTMGWWHLPLAH